MLMTTCSSMALVLAWPVAEGHYGYPKVIPWPYHYKQPLTYMYLLIGSWA